MFKCASGLDVVREGWIKTREKKFLNTITKRRIRREKATERDLV